LLCDISLNGERFTPSDVDNALQEAYALHEDTDSSDASMPRKERGEVMAVTEILQESTEDDEAAVAVLFIACKVWSRVSGMRFGRGINLQNTQNIGDLGINIELVSHESPLMCWVPVGPGVGDLIAVVHSFDMPMLLHRVSGAEERYWFLAVCYVHGFTNGEALKSDDFSSRYIIIN
jgi:hypothetical protein